MYPIAIKAIFGESLLKVQSWGWAILCWVQNMMGRSCFALMRNECINPQMWRYPFLRSYQWDPEFRTGKHMPGLVTSAVFPCKHLNMIWFFFASISRKFSILTSSSFLWCLKPEFVLVNIPLQWIAYRPIFSPSHNIRLQERYHFSKKYCVLLSKWTVLRNFVPAS